MDEENIDNQDEIVSVRPRVIDPELLPERTAKSRHVPKKALKAPVDDAKPQKTMWSAVVQNKYTILVVLVIIVVLIAVTFIAIKFWPKEDCCAVPPDQHSKSKKQPANTGDDERMETVKHYLGPSQQAAEPQPAQSAQPTQSTRQPPQATPPVAPQATSSTSTRPAARKSAPSHNDLVRGMKREHLQNMLSLSKAASQKQAQEEAPVAETATDETSTAEPSTVESTTQESPQTENPVSGADSEPGHIDVQTPPEQPSEIAPGACDTVFPSPPPVVNTFVNPAPDHRNGLCSTVTGRGDFCKNKAVKDGKCALHKGK